MSFVKRCIITSVLISTSLSVSLPFHAAAVEEARTASGQTFSYASSTVTIGSAAAAKIAADAKAAGGKAAPKITFLLSKDVFKANTPIARTYRTFYDQGGTVNHNSNTNKEPLKPTKNDKLSGLYYATLVTLCQKDYITRTKTKPSYIGIPSSLDAMAESDMAAIRTWLRKSFPDASVGNLSELIANYPGIDNDTPLSELGAIDTQIEAIYRIDEKTFVVSALAHYGELMRFGYDIGLEQTKNGWTVHFFKQMWSA